MHDTHFVVGHFHYVMFGGTGFAFFAAMHYWLPKFYGRRYAEKPAIVAWALMFTGFNVMYFTMQVLGMKGMPRRYYDYLPEFATLNLVATIGSWILVCRAGDHAGQPVPRALVGGAVRGEPLGRSHAGVEHSDTAADGEFC